MFHPQIKKDFGSFQQETWYDTKSRQAELEDDNQEDVDDQESNEDVEDDY